jgi:hypothetical protein
MTTRRVPRVSKERILLSDSRMLEALLKNSFKSSTRLLRPTQRPTFSEEVVQGVTEVF